jgi:hypothetical protein
MNPIISLGPPTLFATSAAGGPQFWTLVVRLAVGLELVWRAGALLFLAWLTRSSDGDGSQPLGPSAHTQKRLIVRRQWQPDAPRASRLMEFRKACGWPRAHPASRRTSSG